MHLFVNQLTTKTARHIIGQEEKYRKTWRSSTWKRPMEGTAGVRELLSSQLPICPLHPLKRPMTNKYLQEYKSILEITKKQGTSAAPCRASPVLHHKNHRLITMPTTTEYKKITAICGSPIAVALITVTCRPSARPVELVLISIRSTTTTSQIGLVVVTS